MNDNIGRGKFVILKVRQIGGLNLNKSTLTLGTLSLCAALLPPFAATSSNARAKDAVPILQAWQAGTNLDMSQLLQEVFSSPVPTGFQQVDVSARVRTIVPIGKTRSQVLAALETVSSSKIVIDLPEQLVVRSNMGRPILDPDARSVVMTFSFNKQNNLTGVRAVYLKSQ